jgi:hypothetical protein
MNELASEFYDLRLRFTELQDTVHIMTITIQALNTAIQLVNERIDGLERGD